MRDFIERSGRRPAGLIVVGSTGTRPSDYHVYGSPISRRQKGVLSRSSSGR
jgi:hypothetical protein